MIALLANPAQIGHREEGHPERPERVAAILEAIANSDLGLAPEPASDAPEAFVRRVHDPSYVAMLDQRSVGLPVSVFVSIKLESQREEALERFGTEVMPFIGQI